MATNRHHLEARAVRGAAALAALFLVLVPLQRADASSGPVVSIWASNGNSPFAGDCGLLTTISPNGDGFRDRALIHIRLASAATVRFQVTKTRIRPEPVFTRTAHLAAGSHTLVWAPPAGTEPGSYLVLLDVSGAGGERALYGARSARAQWHGNTPVVRVQGLDAGFTRESYRAGDTATLAVATDAARFSLQVFGLGRKFVHDLHDRETSGVALTKPEAIDWQSHRSTGGNLQIPVGDWPSGVYYVRLTDDTGRVGYAPMIVRPNRIGEHRVAVVLPTNTWQAYNREDLDGNGWGDTWYSGWVVMHVQLGRHYQGWGMPPAFRRYDLPYLRWLQNRRHDVDYLTDSDLHALASPDTLSQAYDLIVFEGHTEYVSTHEYDLIERYRDHGGHLAYLTANNFFWRLTVHGRTITRTKQWRDLDRDESELIGGHYTTHNHGYAPYVARHVEDAPWLFSGTGIHDGTKFLRGGNEIDQMTSRSPKGTKVLAEIPNLFGPGKTAQMTYYEKGGAKVFAAGAFTLAGCAMTPIGGELLDNLWDHLTRR